MFGMRIDTAKSNFFDRAAVVGAMDRATQKVFNRFGGTTRLIARRSIRKIGKNGKASSPGQPPRSRTGLLREHIYYAYERQARSVVIGPALFARSSWAQMTLEHGGAVRQKNKRRRFRTIGQGGEIRVYDGRPCRTTKATADGQQHVTYAKLTTQAQADRANRLNELIYGPAESTATVAPRPYMAPAFEKAKTKLPEFWENAINKS
jgi:hypothetical protein